MNKLLELANNSRLIEASIIVSSGSSDCVFEMAASPVRLEREMIDTPRLQYKRNTFFCLIFTALIVCDVHTAIYLHYHIFTVIKFYDHCLSLHTYKDVKT